MMINAKDFYMNPKSFNCLTDSLEFADKYLDDIYRQYKPEGLDLHSYLLCSNRGDYKQKIVMYCRKHNLTPQQRNELADFNKAFVPIHNSFFNYAEKQRMTAGKTKQIADNALLESIGF